MNTSAPACKARGADARWLDGLCRRLLLVCVLAPVLNLLVP